MAPQIHDRKVGQSGRIDRCFEGGDSNNQQRVPIRRAAPPVNGSPLAMPCASAAGCDTHILVRVLSPRDILAVDSSGMPRIRVALQSLQVGSHFRRGLVTQVPIFLQRSTDDGFDGDGEVRIEFRGWRGVRFRIPSTPMCTIAFVLTLSLRKATRSEWCWDGAGN